MVLGLALTLTAVGCRKHPYDPNTIYGQKHNIAGPGANDELPNGREVARSPHDIGERGTSPVGGGPLGPGHTGWIEDHDSLKTQTVYFDFDKSTIKPGEVSKLNAVIDYLKSHQNAAVRVEGNCDERGTESTSLAGRTARAGVAGKDCCGGHRFEPGGHGQLRPGSSG